MSSNNLKMLGNRIKLARTNIDMSQQELADKVGTSKSMISAYESGSNDPRQSIVIKLATALNVSINWLLGVSNNSITIKDPDITRTVTNMSKMNNQGRERVADYSDDILERYSDTPAPLIAEDYTELYTTARAAAGAGAYNQGYDDGSYIRIHLSDTPEYDAIVDVRGDSMSPTIEDGDVAFVDFSFDKKDGEIYIVQHDDDTYIKRCFFEPDKLTMKSENEAYKDIVFENRELEQVRIIGVVTDWATPEK